MTCSRPVLRLAAPALPPAAEVGMLVHGVFRTAAAWDRTVPALAAALIRAATPEVE